MKFINNFLVAIGAVVAPILDKESSKTPFSHRVETVTPSAGCEFANFDEYERRERLNTESQYTHGNHD